MTANVDETIPRNQYAATANQSIFTYNFPISDSDNLVVYYTKAGITPDDNDDLLSLDVGYTVTGVNDPSGGTIVLTTTEFPGGAAVNAIITIQRSSPIERITQFTPGAIISANDLNDALNYLTKICQDIRVLAQSLAPHYDNSDVSQTDRDLVLPILPASHFWKMSEDGTGIAAVTEEESTGWSTLRSELASVSTDAPGTDDIGTRYSGQNLTDYLNSLGGYLPIQDNQAQFENSVDNSKRLTIDCVNIPTATTLILDAAALVGSQWETGDTLWSARSSKSTWILMQNGTVGNASSNATVRANADTQNLFELLWDTLPTNQPMFSSTGVYQARGGSAAADFALNYQIALPLNEGRGIVNIGSAAFTGQVTATNATNLFTTSNFYTDIQYNLPTGTKIQLSSTGTLPTGVSSATDYYVIRLSTTTFKIATTLALALAGTALTFTDDGTGVISYTRQDNAIITEIGSIAGEYEHAMLGSELAPHSHTYTKASSQLGGSQGGPVQGFTDTAAVTGITGDSGSLIPVISPTTGLNLFMKL